MLPTNNHINFSKVVGWTLTALLLAASVGLWVERQRVIDVIQYYQYSPSSQIQEITKNMGLTDNAKFMFYASRPSVETSKSFNTYCKRQEADSPILGCYAGQRIHIYDITDSRLDGIEEVTAAHELLHAEYERLPESEKRHLEQLLDVAYQKVADDELRKRMDYYARTQPGEKYNELHSILPTEYADIGNDLERYYREYFTNRSAIVQQHAQVAMQFTQLSKEADELVEKINALTVTVNNNIQRYNGGVAALNQKVITFNARADRPGGFASQAEFNAERAALENERAELEALRAQINSDTDLHARLVAQLDTINARTESLNKSIDSVLANEPEI